MSFKTCGHASKFDTLKNQNKGANTKNQQRSALNRFQCFFKCWSISHLWSPPVFRLHARASFRSGDGTSFSASGDAERPAMWPSGPGEIGVAGLLMVDFCLMFFNFNLINYLRLSTTIPNSHQLSSTIINIHQLSPTPEFCWLARWPWSVGSSYGCLLIHEISMTAAPKVLRHLAHHRTPWSFCFPPPHRSLASACPEGDLQRCSIQIHKYHYIYIYMHNMHNMYICICVYVYYILL